MKSLRVACLVAIVAAVACVPVSNKSSEEEAEVVVVPLGSPSELFGLEDGVMDTGLPGGFFSFNPFGNPFGGFMQSMEEMMTRLRDQMSQVLHRLPPDNVEWKEIGEGKGNTTSTIKIIDGHKVTINETTYTDENDNSGAVFKIRIVDVHPTSEEDTTDGAFKKPATTTKPSKEAEATTSKNTKKGAENSSPELIEESANEIPRGKQEISNPLDDDIETLGEGIEVKLRDDQPFESKQSLILSNPEYTESNSIEDYAPPVRDIETNDVDFEPIDLSNDILVNQMLADANAPHNPDAEIITIDDNKQFEYPIFEKMSPYPQVIIDMK